MRKQIQFDYGLKAKVFTMHQGKKVSIKIAEAKPVLFDLIAFISILGLLAAIAFICPFIGYSESKAQTVSRGKKNK